MSIRDSNGDNIFAIKPEELKRGREGAAYDELKYISQTAEYFLAGVLHGLTDGKSIVIYEVEMTLSHPSYAYRECYLHRSFRSNTNHMIACTNYQRL